MPTTLTFTLNGEIVHADVQDAYNAGYTGRDQNSVKNHIAELKDQGVAPPSNIPTLFSVPSYMCLQSEVVEVPHENTSGEAEWALLYRGEEQSPLITVASDHTDRQLEAYSVAASKQISPNVMGNEAWDLAELGPEINRIQLLSRVKIGDEWTVLQRGYLGDLMSPADWICRLKDSDRLAPGTVVLGGTLPMIRPDDQFSKHWEVALVRPNGESIVKEYRVKIMKPSIV